MMNKFYRYQVLIFVCFLSLKTYAQKKSFTHQDSLFGGTTPERVWWDVTYYHLNIRVFPDKKSILGSNTIKYKVLKPFQTMQIELQPPLKIDSIVQDNKVLKYRKDGFSYFISLVKKQKKSAVNTVKIFYGGKPHVSKNPPWSGGITWAKDSLGKPFIASTCEGIGASIWWPCKDQTKDEADSVLISITLPDSLTDVSNGRLRKVVTNDDGTHTFNWFVDNPINNYGIAINIGNYVHFGEEYNGLNGKLDCNYYVLKGNLQKAKKQFKQVPRMLKAFEYWFGPYPFYKDGYKLVQTPYLGMEHQSCVGYGNKFANGYLGMDISGTGWGQKFDFIIIHESAHEWFANSITAADVTDLWIHESFATYAEALYLNYYYGDSAADDYIIGLRKNILNNAPLIGKYGVHDEAPEDIYDKGANMLHTLRQIVNNDIQFRAILLGLNKRFFHKTVYSSQIENYIDSLVPVNLKPFFDEYLRTVKIPDFTYKIRGKRLIYKYSDVVTGFVMPIDIYVKGKKIRLQNASDKWNNIKLRKRIKKITIDRNYYVKSSKIR